MSRIMQSARYRVAYIGGFAVLVLGMAWLMLTFPGLAGVVPRADWAYTAVSLLSVFVAIEDAVASRLRGKSLRRAIAQGVVTGSLVGCAVGAAFWSANTAGAEWAAYAAASGAGIGLVAWLIDAWVHLKFGGWDDRSASG
jgi:hypothetical protein